MGKGGYKDKRAAEKSGKIKIRRLRPYYPLAGLYRVQPFTRIFKKRCK
jgi:hypothetical protein